MGLKSHIAVSSILGLILGFTFKSYLIGILSWLIGWVIDCDHFFDYFLYLLKFKKDPNLKEFFLPSVYLGGLGKIYVLAHAWEYLFIFLVVSFFYKLSFPFVVTIGFSYGLHLFLDQFSNNARPWVYFLLYRIKVGFSANKLSRY